MEGYPNVWTPASHDVLPQNLHERYKVAIWIMASILFLGLAWDTEEHMPPELVFVFWTSSELFAFGAGYWLFIHGVPNTAGSGNKMKGVLWAFAAVLNLVFSLQKIKSFPSVLVMLVYLKSGFVIIGGFYRLFFSRVARHPDPILPLYIID